MRIALLARGSSIHTSRWAESMASLGIDVHLISNKEETADRPRQVTVHELPFSAPYGYYANVVALRRLLRNIDPDLLHAHYASGYGTLARLSRFRPEVLSVWGSDVYRVPQRSRYYRNLVAKNIRHADWVCSTSRCMAHRTHQLCGLIPRLTVVPFGVDTNWFTEACRAPTSNPIVVGTVKSLTPTYGIDTLIRAFAAVRHSLADGHPDRARQLRLSIVGNGPQSKELRGLADEVGINDVTEFAGDVPHRDVPHRLREFDIFVAASRHESFGVAVIEASACGLPVVVSNAWGLREVVKENITGFVVSKDDVEGLSQALMKLVLDPALRRKMGRAGREHVIAHYEWDENVKQMIGVYEKTIVRNRRACKKRGSPWWHVGAIRRPSGSTKSQQMAQR